MSKNKIESQRIFEEAKKELSPQRSGVRIVQHEELNVVAEAIWNTADNTEAYGGSIVHSFFNPDALRFLEGRRLFKVSCYLFCFANNAGQFQGHPLYDVAIAYRANLVDAPFQYFSNPLDIDAYANIVYNVGGAFYARQTMKFITTAPSATPVPVITSIRSTWKFQYLL